MAKKRVDSWNPAKLPSRGVNVNFNIQGVDFVKDNLIVAQNVRLNNNLHLMNMQAEAAGQPAAFHCQEKRTLEEWHYTLGHASVERIKKLLKDQDIDISPAANDNDFNCVDRPRGEARLSSHPSTNRRATTTGRRVFMDLSGPHTETHQGNKYFMLCKDECKTHC